LKAIQIALVVMAVAVSLQTILLLAGIWFCYSAWTRGKEQLDQRFGLLQARLQGAAAATEQTMASIDRCATQTSSLLRHLERLAAGMATVAGGPRTWAAAGSASKLLSRWRRRRRNDSATAGA
jgi:hypothetical protein